VTSSAVILELLSQLSKKNDPPHPLKLALHIIKEDVLQPSCTSVAVGSYLSYKTSFTESIFSAKVKVNSFS